jgi:hypothetical protein
MYCMGQTYFIIFLILSLRLFPVIAIVIRKVNDRYRGEEGEGREVIV